MQPQRADDYNHLPPRFGGGSVLLLIIIVTLFMGVPQKIYHHLTAVQHKKVKQYLDVGKRYTYFINDDHHAVLRNMPHIHESEMDKLLATNASFQREVSQLTPPKSFKHHHQLLITSIALTETYLLKSKQHLLNRNSQTIRNELDELRIDIETTRYELRESMLQGLKAEQIDYEIQSDGSVVYYIHVKNELERLNYDLYERRMVNE